MSNSISALLTRNLHDVFGENDPVRRRLASDEIFTEDCVFYEPKGVYRGRDVPLPETPFPIQLPPHKHLMGVRTVAHVSTTFGN